MISPGERLRLTVKVQLLGMNPRWLDISMETTIPALPSGQGKADL